MIPKLWQAFEGEAHPSISQAAELRKKSLEDLLQVDFPELVSPVTIDLVIAKKLAGLEKRVERLEAVIPKAIGIIENLAKDIDKLTRDFKEGKYDLAGWGSDDDPPVGHAQRLRQALTSPYEEYELARACLQDVERREKLKFPCTDLERNFLIKLAKEALISRLEKIGLEWIEIIN